MESEEIFILNSHLYPHDTVNVLVFSFSLAIYALPFFRS